MNNAQQKVTFQVEYTFYSSYLAKIVGFPKESSSYQVLFNFYDMQAFYYLAYQLFLPEKGKIKQVKTYQDMDQFFDQNNELSVLGVLFLLKHNQQLLEKSQIQELQEQLDKFNLDQQKIGIFKYISLAIISLKIQQVEKSFQHALNAQEMLFKTVSNCEQPLQFLYSSKADKGQIQQKLSQNQKDSQEEEIKANEIPKTQKKPNSSSTSQEQEKQLILLQQKQIQQKQLTPQQVCEDFLIKYFTYDHLAALYQSSSNSDKLISSELFYLKAIQCINDEYDEASIVEMEPNPRMEFAIFLKYASLINYTLFNREHNQFDEILSQYDKLEVLIGKLFKINPDEKMLYRALFLINKSQANQDLNNLEDAYKELSEALDIMSKSKHFYKEKFLAQIHNNLSSILQEMQKLDKSLEHALIALQINEQQYKDNRENSEVAKNIMNIASIYKDLNQLQEALTYAQEAEKIFTKLMEHNDSIFASSLAICQGNISVIFQMNGNLVKSKEYCLKSIKQFESISQISTEIASSYYNLSNIYQSENNLFEALDYANKSLEIYQKCFTKYNWHPTITDVLDHIANLNREMGNLEEALGFYLNVLERRKQQFKDEPSEELLLCYNNIALLFQELEYFEESSNYAAEAALLESRMQKDSNFNDQFE